MECGQDGLYSGDRPECKRKLGILILITWQLHISLLSTELTKSSITLDKEHK